MDLNPYDAPTAVVPTLAQRPPEEYVRRPLGIWLLSALHLLVGLGFLALPIIIVGMWLLEIPQATGVVEPEWLIIGLLCGMSAFAIATGVGLWIGARWGWWMSAFYYVLAAVSFVFEMPFRMWQMVRLDDENLPFMAPVLLIRLILQVLLALYFFKRNVRAYYRLQSLSIPKALSILIGISVVLMLATGGVVFLLVIASRQ